MEPGGGEAPPRKDRSTVEGAVYFLIDGNGTEISAGPFLIPVARSLAATETAAAAMHALLAGPDTGEAASRPGLSTAIPAGTRLIALEVEGGVASLDLSAEFLSGGGSFSMRARLAQVIFTLTRFPDVSAVAISVGGVPMSVFGGEGVEIAVPADRTGFDDLLPAIAIESPPYGGLLAPSAMVVGSAVAFEATLEYVITDADGLIIFEGFETASCGSGCRGFYGFTAEYEVDRPQMGALIVFAESAEDGGQQDVMEYPVALLPSD